MARGIIFWGIGAFVGLLAAGNTLCAESFRIETSIYAEDEAEPLGKNLTLFEGDLIYDYTLTGSPQTVVFKHAGKRLVGRFILLNVERGERTEIPTDRVSRLATNVAAWARQQGDPLLQFSGAPKFEVALDEKQQELTFHSEVMEYRVKLLAARSEAASAHYREFADWFARLDTLLRPGSRPPHPRLEVNRELADRQSVPSEVRLHIGTSDGKRGTGDIRSEHQVAWRLTRADRERIDETNQQLVTFRLVDLESFQR